MKPPQFHLIGGEVSDELRWEELGWGHVSKFSAALFFHEFFLMTAFPVELWTQIILQAVQNASLADFAKLSSLCKATRVCLWPSVAVHAELLLSTFGRDKALIAILSPPVAVPLNGNDVGDEESEDYQPTAVAPNHSKWLDMYAQFQLTSSSEDLVRTLLRFGAAADAQESLALRLCTRRKGGEAIVSVLVDSVTSMGNLVRARDSEAFRDACRLGYLRTAKLLLDAGADLHARADEALRFAACFGQSDSVAFLVSEGATISALHNASLFGAIDMGYENVVIQLLAAGADPNEPLHGITGASSPLQKAVCAGKREIVEVLLSYGANALYENCAAKREATRRNYADIVEVLTKAETELAT
ncbi:ankyrin repeat-containing domain protein [Chytriomyces sp. MP71]|nr:ankyrin repeat-containing domain protein [Chytriomyces sp. MP71]